MPIDGQRAFHVTGCVEGWPPVYAIIGYLDPDGRQDYDARVVTTALIRMASLLSSVMIW